MRTLILLLTGQYSNDSSRIERGEDLNKIENDVFP